MSRSLLLSDFGDSGQENQAATCHFFWSFGAHISAIPLGDANPIPTILHRLKQPSVVGIKHVLGIDALGALVLAA